MVFPLQITKGENGFVSISDKNKARIDFAFHSLKKKKRYLEKQPIAHREKEALSDYNRDWFFCTH